MSEAEPQAVEAPDGVEQPERGHAAEREVVGDAPPRAVAVASQPPVASGAGESSPAAPAQPPPPGFSDADLAAAAAGEDRDLPPEPQPDLGAEDALPGPAGPPLSVEDVLDLRVRLSAELGRARLPVAHVVNLEDGAIVDLDRAPEDPVDLFVNGLRFGTGRLVLVGDEWAVRLETVVDAVEQAPSAAQDPAGADDYTG